MKREKRYRLVFERPNLPDVVWVGLRAISRQDALRLAIKQYYGVSVRIRKGELKFSYGKDRMYFKLEK